jgi:hypothetical protein
MKQSFWESIEHLKLGTTETFFNLQQKSGRIVTACSWFIPFIRLMFDVGDADVQFKPDQQHQ